uniref:Uncharacterized protein n=1 Tax=Arundo donax TaxID=35708 RepID=A0A0A9BNW4_ARUDO
MAALWSCSVSGCLITRKLLLLRGQ